MSGEKLELSLTVNGIESGMGVQEAVGRILLDNPNQVLALAEIHRAIKDAGIKRCTMGTLRNALTEIRRDEFPTSGEVYTVAGRSSVIILEEKFKFGQRVDLPGLCSPSVLREKGPFLGEQLRAVMNSGRVAEGKSVAPWLSPHQESIVGLLAVSPCPLGREDIENSLGRRRFAGHSSTPVHVYGINRIFSDWADEKPNRLAIRSLGQGRGYELRVETS